MERKENRRVRMTKKILQESLLELLKTQDIHEISIRALCEKADLNRSTFYKYYGSQYDLLQEMENELLERIEQDLSNFTTASSCKECLTKLLSFANEHVEFSRLLFSANIDPNLPKKMLGLPSIYNALDLATQNTSAEETQYMQDFFFYGGYQIIKRWISKENRESPEKLAGILTKFFGLNFT